MSGLPTPSLHLVTSRARLAPDARTTREQVSALDAQIDAAIAAGVDIIHIRERDMDAGLLLGLVERAVARASGTSTRILVNERADVAAAAGASGVHLPASGLPATRVRALSATWIVGRSTHVGEEPRDLAAVDYVLFGTVYSSESKQPGSPVAGLDALAASVRAVACPVVAIGGLTPDRAGECLRVGAGGVAAIGAFLPPGRARDALGVETAVPAFRAAMSGA